MNTHRTAHLLGYLALLPFVAAPLIAYGGIAMPTAKPISSILASYAALVVSFIGGIHWGLALRQQNPAASLYVWGVVPAIAAWLLALAPTAWQLPGYAALLVACFAVDRRVYPREGLQSWLGLRLHLTAVATACCAVLAWRPAV